MITSATQATRQLALFTPLGEDRLLLRRFFGREELSGLFEYELQALSADDAIDPARIIGQNVTFVLRQSEDETRYFNGLVSRFGYSGQDDRAVHYRMTVVPWLWLLTNTADCRIFQEQSTPEIVQRIFQELGFTDFELRLRGDYPRHPYCVQYRETDFAFVSRLMEEEGIFYYFRHENGRHTLVLADQASAYMPLPEGEVDFGDPDASGDLVDQITAWEHQYEFRPGRWAQTDYNFQQPDSDLMSQERSVVPLPSSRKFEIYDFPGRHQDEERGRRLARVRMEEQEAGHDVVTGSSTYRGFTPGGVFRVRSHLSRVELGRSYALTRVETTASVDGAYVTGSGAGELRFENRFRCLPASVPFRPPRATPRPVVEGSQTAVVVGPGGEEIYTDEHSRVKVQFHWDREGRRDENSSCWIRVSQAHAGQGWGGIDLPRIGEEVIVDFLEGDPDHPIITGRVYNARNMPPFALPAQMTRSGMKTQTHKGAGANEISMDDTAGQEQIRMVAQHDMDTAVGNNQTLIVNVDRTAEIGNNDATTVGNDAVESVGNDKSVEVGSDMHVQVGNKLVFNAGSSITLKCGASRLHMTAGGIVTLTGTIITMAAAANASVVSPMTQVVGGVMLTTIGGVNMMNGGVCHVGAAGLASVAGGQVDVVSPGETSIKGGLITLN